MNAKIQVGQNTKIGSFKYHCLKDKNKFVVISLYAFSINLFVNSYTLQIENDSYYALSYIDRKEFVPNVFEYFKKTYYVVLDFFRNTSKENRPKYLIFHMTNNMNNYKRDKHIRIYKDIIIPKISKELNENLIYFDTMLKNNLDFIIFKNYS